MELSQNTLIVLLDNLVRNAFYTKDLDIETSTIGQGVLDGSECLFVHLVHMYV